MDIKIDKNNKITNNNYPSDSVKQKEDTLLSNNKGIFDNVQESSDEEKPIIIIDSKSLDETTKESLRNKNKKTPKKY